MVIRMERWTSCPALDFDILRLDFVAHFVGHFVDSEFGS